MQLPGVQSVSITPVRVRLSGYGAEAGKGIVVDSSVTDTGSTPNWRIRPGQVLAKRTSTGRFIMANDANADVRTAASITSSGHTDAKSTIKLVGNHGTISVTVTTGTGTEAECATDLNADAIFKAHYVASSGGGELTIASTRTGADEWFYMHSDTHANYGFAEGVDNVVKGTDPEIVVLDEFVDLEDKSGTACHGLAVGWPKGHFDESNLRNLTGEAKEVLLRNGSIFA